MANGTDGTTNPSYPQSLQQILGRSQTPGVFGYGFSKDDIQALQQAGITQTDLMGMGLSTQPGTTTTAYQSGGSGSPQTQVSAGGLQQSNNARLLAAMLKLGQGQQQQGGGPQAPPSEYGKDYPLYATDAQGMLTGKPVAYAGAQNQLSLLGAAATDNPLVINQIPSSALDPKSGVAKVGGALVGSNVPTVGVTWDQLAKERPYLTPDTIAALQKSGVTAEQAAGGVGVKVPLAGPWTRQPGVFTQAQRTTPTEAIPLGAAAQPTATAYNPTATPFAQAPAAPGVNLGVGVPPPSFLAAHTSGLEDAGKALFAHFGGDPNSATHADIANFHSQLTSALAAAPQPTAAKVPAFGSAYGTPPPITVPPWQGGQAGTGTAVAGQGGLPPANIIGTTPSGPIPPPTPMPAPWQGTKKMASGGFVPGRGNKDTVPALLTPGEYVIPKDQVPAYLKMDKGGVVPDPNADPNAPPETRRQTLSVPTPPTQSSQPSQSSSASSAPPAAPGGGQSSLVSGLTQAAHTYNTSFQKGLFGAGGPIPRGSTAGAGAYGTVGSLMAGQGSAGAAGSLGKLPAGGGMQSALGGIGSGLTQAAQAIAASTPPWQMQSYQQPFGSGVAPAPQVAFQAPPAPSQAQQGANPYAAYAINQARYPTSPDYT